MRVRRSTVSVLVAGWLAACSSAPTADRVTSIDNAGSGASIMGGKCTPGALQCFCDDGTQQGTQACNPNGTLTPCACPVAVDPTIMPQPNVVANTDAALCADLAGKVGCMAQSYQSSELAANVLFVLDRSGSMACNPPPLQDSAACESQAAPVDGTQPSKWQITVAALERVFDDLLARHSTANVGLTFFSNDNTCGVQSTPSVPVAALSPAQVAALKSALAATTPSGGTPLVGATTLAYAYLHQEASQAAGCVEPCGAHGNRYAVLITDGTDSCATPSRAQDAAECSAAGSCTNFLVKKAAPLAARANIKTFVIGAPGSEPARGYLSELAFVGGTPRNAGKCSHDPSASSGDCHFDMTSTQDFAGALAGALGSISGAALGCEFAVPQTGVAVSKGSVNVQYRGAKNNAVCFKYDDRACEAGADGWQFATKADGSQDLSRVVICGKACDQVRADASARVDVVLGCETIVLQ
jgi:hypothetical protein